MDHVDNPASVHRNEVRLVGRVSGPPTAISLPSGDSVATVRVVVERGGRSGEQVPRQRVDTLVCAVWRPGLQDVVMAWCHGDVVEVRGALRRRFWRGDGVPQSRYEIELTEARRIAVTADASEQVSSPASA